MISRRRLLLSALPASLLQYPPTEPQKPIAPHIDTFYQEYKTFEFWVSVLVGGLRRDVARLKRDVPGRRGHPQGGNV